MAVTLRRVAASAAGQQQYLGLLWALAYRIWLLLPAFAILVGAALIWQFYVESSGIRPQVLPSPARVLREAWEFRGIIWDNTIPTLKETAIGFCISVAVATLFAVVMDFSGAARRALYPLLVTSQTLPIIAIAPLLIIWFGFGLTPKIVVVALVTFFPVTVALVDGFNSTEREAMNLLRSMGANRLRIFWYVRLPSALPYFFSGLRIAITYSVVGAIFAEYVGAKNGLGIFMALQKNSFRTDLVLAAVFVTAFITVLLFLSTYVVERLAIPWYAASRRAYR